MSGSYNANYVQQDRIQTDWSYLPDGRVLPYQVMWRPGPKLTSRTAANLAVDYKITDDLIFSLRSNYSFYDVEYFNQYTYLIFGTPTVSQASADSTSTHISVNPNGTNTRLHTQYSHRYAGTPAYLIAPKLEYKGETWEAALRTSYSSSEFNFRDRSKGFFQRTDSYLTRIGFTLDRDSPTSNAWTLGQTAGRPWGDPTSFNRDDDIGNNIRTSESDAVNEMYSINLDLKKKFNLGDVYFTLMGGAGARTNDWRTNEGSYQQFQYVGPTGDLSQKALEAVVPWTQNYKFEMIGFDAGNMNAQNWRADSNYATYDIYKTNPEYFVVDVVGNLKRRLDNDKQVKEDITSAYFEAQADAGRTLPVGQVDRFRLGLFSCCNMPMGWFNAYAHAAARDDVDLWFHVGDYVYEYGLSSYAADDLIAGRDLLPAHDHEMIALADYRLRLACYRGDEDLQRLHQAAPMISLWDDHECSNDSWEGGAQNHQSQDGDWSVRRAAAAQAYLEWMPISEEPWKAYTIGALATLYRTESRLIGGTRQADIGGAFRAESDAALQAFRDGPWSDPSATMLGSTQESWLAQAFKRNALTTAWQIVGMGAVLGRTVMPQDAVSWLRLDAGEKTVRSFEDGVRAARADLPMWMDRWDGYPAARSRFLKAAQQADADLVMLSGDSHNAWAYSLAEDGRPAGVEFAGQAVTSNGIEKQLGVSPEVAARSFVAANPEMAWAQTSGRGYMVIDVTPERVGGEWVFMQTIKSRSTALAGVHRMSVERGRRRFLS